MSISQRTSSAERPRLVAETAGGERSRLVPEPQPDRLTGPQSKPGGRDRLAKVMACIVATEFLIVAATAYFASAAYHRIILMQSPPTGQYMPAALFIAALITLASLSLQHFSAIQSQSRRHFAWRGITVVGSTFILFLWAMFVFKVTEDYSRGVFLVQLVTTAAAVATFRVMALSLVRSAIAHGYLEASRVVLVGDPILSAPVLKYLTNQGLRAVRSFPFPVRHGGRRSGIDDEIDLTQVHTVIAECRMLRPDDILIVPADDHLQKAAQLAPLLSELPATIHLLPFAAEDYLPAARVGKLGTQITINFVSRPLSIFDRALKRAFDITVALASLVLLSPLLLLIATAITLESRGPALFRQMRHGFNNEPIRIFKFRSMTVAEDGGAFEQAKKADARVTRFGRILRRSNLDEVPQLLNVLLGDMSIVGPRPHAIAHNNEFAHRVASFGSRHKIKPGITGWAQVNGYRGETDTLEKMKRRVEYDLYYLDNWSFLFDMQIILMTLFSPRSYLNAY